MADPIAVYGAITGTAGAAAGLWAIWNGTHDRARIKTEVRNIVTEYPGIRPGALLCAINVINQGRRPVTISGYAGLAFSAGHWFPFAGVLGELPRRLDESATITFWMYEDALVEGVREQGEMPSRVLVNDDGGHTHKRRISGPYLRRLKRLVQG